MHTLEKWITALIEDKIDFPFDSIFESVKEVYLRKNRFISIRAATCNEISWPQTRGVYVIWKASSNEKHVVYIGMTGKVSSNGMLSGKQTLSDRKTRWSPYKFDNKFNEFKFAPLYERHESRNSAPSKGYKNSISIASITIDCFLFDANEKLAPTFLESLLLQGFLLQFETLPPANNNF